jgi:argininosuccinate synthase
LAERIVLAYSGGLDTSVAVFWLAEERGFEVFTLTVDLGSQPELETIKRRALAAGARRAVVEDQRQAFVEEFCWPALRAGALYQGQYPLATALGRPLIARRLVEVAREEGAGWVAHGSTGKGNDQVRFDVSVAAMAPELKVLAPLRDGMTMTREEEIAYAGKHGIPIALKPESPYSVDENLWGRSIEAGVLEDPTVEPPEDAFLWTAPIEKTPADPEYFQLDFRAGIPVALDGRAVDPIALIDGLNRRAGRHGVGRIDMVEDRFVGIKSREVYEAPAATVLHQAHGALEQLVLDAETARFKALVAQEYARLVYQVKWFSAHRRDLDAYVESTQRFCEGTVRVKLHRGTARVVARSSPYSLYRPQLATYSRGDEFDHQAAVGFIKLVGLPVRTQARVQGLSTRKAPPD